MRHINKNEVGFTLVEIIIVIAIIVLVTGFVGFGLSYLFATDLDAKAENIANIIRSTRNVQVEHSGQSYWIEIEVGVDETLFVQKVKDDTGSISQTGYPAVNLNGNFTLEWNRGAGGSFVAVPNGERIEFSNSTNKVISGAAIYRITRTSGDYVVLKVQAENGRVVVDDK